MVVSCIPLIAASHSILAAGNTVQSAILDVAAILRLHTFVVRMATVICTHQSPKQQASEAQQLSPDARSIAEHATMQQQATELDPHQPSPGLMPVLAEAGHEDTGPSLPLQQSAADGQAGWTQWPANALSWAAPSGLQLSLHLTSSTQVVLMARKCDHPAPQQPSSPSLPVPDTGQQPAEQHRLAQPLSSLNSDLDGFGAGLDVRSSLDFLSGMEQDGIQAGLQGQSSWPWAADGNPTPTPPVDNAEGFGDFSALPATSEQAPASGLPADQQDQAQSKSRQVRSGPPLQVTRGVEIFR